jgi:hypothetical protein
MRGGRAARSRVTSATAAGVRARFQLTWRLGERRPAIAGSTPPLTHANTRSSGAVAARTQAPTSSWAA